MPARSPRWPCLATSPSAPASASPGTPPRCEQRRRPPSAMSAANIARAGPCRSDGSFRVKSSGNCTASIWVAKTSSGLHRTCHGLHVAPDNLRRRAVGDDLALVHPQDAIAEFFEEAQVVADHEDDVGALDNRTHPLL